MSMSIGIPQIAELVIWTIHVRQTRHILLPPVTTGGPKYYNKHNIINICNINSAHSMGTNIIYKQWAGARC